MTGVDHFVGIAIILAAFGHPVWGMLSLGCAIISYLKE